MTRERAVQRAVRLAGANEARGAAIGGPAQHPPRRRNAHADSRLPLLLDAAAAQFAAKGFQATSIRDVVRAVGMLPGSLYCHFSSKDELLVAVYGEGVRRIDAAVTAAVARETEPWARIEAACVAHLESILNKSAYAKVVVSVHPAEVPAVAAELVTLRDGYERKLVVLLEALRPTPGERSRVLRMLLLGALNWTPTWYRAGGSSPRKIAREYVRVLKDSLTR